MIKHEKITFKNYGSCIKLSNGIIEAVVTIDIGPRIVYFGFVGKENIMNSAKDEFGETNNEKFDNHFYKGATWRNYGGHRLWVSPEKEPDTYYPDCKPVSYTITDNGVILTPDEQIENKRALQVELSMHDNEPVMDVTHVLKNTSDTVQDIAPWALSVCERGGVLIVPMNTNNTGLLHNRVMSIWPYTDPQDKRLFLGKKYVTLIQDPQNEDCMKLGFDLNVGRAFYVLGNSVFEKKYYPNHPNGRYPDGGVSMETYNCGLFIEIETLGEQKQMQTGEEVSHKETWIMHKKPCSFDPKNDSSVDNFVNKLN